MSDTLKLPIEAAPLSPTFRGTPQQMFEAMVERMRVLFPTGQTSFTISDTEPGTNIGPWLKGGTQWYVWSEADKRYVPFDASPSWEVAISQTPPATGAKPIWIKFSPATDSDPARALGIFLYLGGGWVAINSPGNSGPTASRPTSPLAFERYFDTEIRCEIYFYSGQWRTVHGSIGDVKYVTHETLADAVKYNPGWTELGQFLSDADVRGRVLVPAHKDKGLTPTANFVPSSGITSRAVDDRFGSEQHTLTSAELPTEAYGPYKVSAGLTRWQADGNTPDAAGGLVGISGGPAYEPAVTHNPAVSPVAQPHTNIPPSHALWALVKL